MKRQIPYLLTKTLILASLCMGLVVGCNSTDVRPSGTDHSSSPSPEVNSNVQIESASTQDIPKKNTISEDETDRESSDVLEQESELTQKESLAASVATELSSTADKSSASIKALKPLENNGGIELYRPTQEASTMVKVERLSLPEVIEGNRWYLCGILDETKVLLELRKIIPGKAKAGPTEYGVYDWKSGSYDKILDAVTEEMGAVALIPSASDTVLVMRTPNNWVDIEYMRYLVQDKKLESLTTVHFENAIGVMQDPLLTQDALYMNIVKDGTMSTLKYDITTKETTYGEEGIFPHLDANGQVSYLPWHKEEGIDGLTIGFPLPGAYRIASFCKGWAKTSKHQFLNLYSKERDDCLKGSLLFRVEDQEALLSYAEPYMSSPEPPSEMDTGDNFDPEVQISISGLEASLTLVGYDVQSSDSFYKFLYDDENDVFLRFEDLPKVGTQEIFMAPDRDLGLICSRFYPEITDSMTSEEQQVARVGQYTIDMFSR